MGAQAARRPRSPQGGPFFCPGRGYLANRATPAPFQSGRPLAPIQVHARVPISGRAAGPQGPAALPFDLLLRGLLSSAARGSAPAPAGALSQSVSAALSSIWVRPRVGPRPAQACSPSLLLGRQPLGILFYWVQSLAAILAAAGLTLNPPCLHKGPGRSAPAYSKGVRSTARLRAFGEKGHFSPVSVPSGRQLRSRSAPESRAPAEWWAAASGIRRLVLCRLRSGRLGIIG
ncbi:hypothetical protein NDU88_001349 [Pleurodeles waltl]|uniref:Uncharacterized protein n=1 Tax=Pleurodeles waltl TaxID=8319 RepID=A0AAV7TIV8_PLEWA|nr:hypothetical protein NDU88_001349 [Pleurodeles waltl]